MQAEARHQQSGTPVATMPGDVPNFIRRGTATYRRASFSLLLGGLSTFNLLYCVQPLMPEFSRVFGVGADQSALCLSLTTAALAPSLLLAAPLADRFGRKPVMLVSVLLSSLLVLAGAIMNDWWGFLATRALLGLTLGGLPAIAMTYLAEEIEPAALGATMSLYIGGNALGGVAARLMNGILADHFSWHLALAITGSLGILGALVMGCLLPRSRVFVPVARREQAQKGGYLSHLKSRRTMLLLAEGALLSGILVTVSNLLGYRLVATPFHLSVTLASLVFVTYLLGSPTTIIASRIAERFGKILVLNAGFCLILLGVGLMILDALTPIALGLAVLTVGFFTAHGSASVLITMGAHGSKAQAASLYLFAFYSGSGIISWFGGHVWIWGGWQAVTLYIALLGTVGFLIAVTLARTANRISGVQH
ncbi:MFS transporter [Sphingobium sp. WCS2017Hpa-17]|uniref:MFS transporter n=1 Tax=Sphingobium sp. WCS2017Hpa-17 TaxID=3073638 RepID=UPI0028891A39|nr:MFS transporter [Sphingobium sp. WCS2017Hpa-17]